MSIPVGHSEYLPDVELLLWANNEFFTGGAVYKRHEGWRVTQCAPCLNFLRKLDPASAKLELARRGYDWHWVRNSLAGNIPRLESKHEAQAIPAPEQPSGPTGLNEAQPNPVFVGAAATRQERRG